MESSAHVGKHGQDVPSPRVLHGEAARESLCKRSTHDKPFRQSAGRIKRAKDSSEFIRVPRKTAEPLLDRPATSHDDDPNARHFTVANVGAGGTLYLMPARAPPPAFSQSPLTPPDIDDSEPGPEDMFGARQSNISVSWTPRLDKIGGFDHATQVPRPPLNLAKSQPKQQRPRSASFSTLNERGSKHGRSSTTDLNGLQVLVNGRDHASRPKSSFDLSGGFLDLQIPHYRIGTPRFSERGTAYLHNSTYTSNTTNNDQDARSSTLFPHQPGLVHGPTNSTRNSTVPYLHPSVGAARYSPNSSRIHAAPASKSPTDGGITPAMYDRIEARPNDPAIVRYNRLNGKIAHATPARLVAQITSALFLDYELLSDFFLTFRNFLLCRDLLEYLIARLLWALGTDTDVGRVVRVRTFVALRHWILNYFGDDFALDINLRRRLCTMVNDISASLQARPDKGGTDINIIGELKKCWRRTCALFWPIEDALTACAEAEISPGGDAEEMPQTPEGSPTRLKDPRVSRPDFRRVSESVEVPADAVYPGRESVFPMFGVDGSRAVRKASIPASPLSVASLQVLSCSVPFLRNIRPSAKVSDRNGIARHVGQKNPPLSGRPGSRASHQHKRSGSFSDALRDDRATLQFNKAESIDIRALPAIAFTGGLVRGLLLQPSPPNLNFLVPLSPGMDQRMAHFDGIEDSYFRDRSAQQNLGVKRIVGDMRRALSSRRRNDSPHRSNRSGHSSDSRSSADMVTGAKSTQQSAWQKLRGPPRVDLLGATVSASYKDAFHDVDLPSPPEERGEQRLPISVAGDEGDNARATSHSLRPLPPRLERLDSHVTAGSRSIVIMDDTGIPPVPTDFAWRALPAHHSVSSGMMNPQPLFNRSQEGLQPGKKRVGTGMQASAGASSLPETPLDEAWNPDHSTSMHDLLTPWKSDDYGNPVDSPALSTDSDDIDDEGLDMPPVGHTLRRRPGGDLKAADHVHSLELPARPYTSGSYSTAYSRYPSSGHELFGTHFSGQFSGPGSMRLPSQFSPDRHYYSRASEQMSPTQMSPSQAAPESLAGKDEPVSLLATHSSQPSLRPSFRLHANNLAQLPNSPQVGGIEDALAKLEGKTGTPNGSTFSIPTLSEEFAALERQDQEQGPSETPVMSMSGGSSTPVQEYPPNSPSTDVQGASIFHLSCSDVMGDDRGYSMGTTGTYPRSDAQDSAAPALPLSPKGSQLPARVLASPKPVSPSQKSVTFVEQIRREAQENEQTQSPGKSSSRKSSNVQSSFLLDDNESLSDISTEIAENSGDDNTHMQSFFFDDTIEDGGNLLPRPAYADPPPTPPSASGAPFDRPPTRSAHSTKAPGPAPLRPQVLQPSPQLKEAQSAPGLLSPNLDKRMQLPPGQDVCLRRSRTSPGLGRAAHLPFVLAFESEVIAEQLTIIEKDALDEVDWKDLISLNWHQAPPHVRNWVDYLKQDNNTGVDIVVARFNLVVKWVVSECLLTETLSDRARCITKYIHIAIHCFRFRNYASMYQITLALLSADLARLHRTWALVAPAEKHKLARLEKLCQPVRNFHNLRTEMESTGAESGCIPFIGLYTHDLMFNAQKPARIDPVPPAKEPLINFERYQTAATIVKSLLRLIEASARYVFHPHPEVLSRCLWLAALEDGEIVARSRSIEAP
ncbi:Guanine nucleotide exchange factor [Teratosphaeria destructans]|uniref:Guanine nucleotide exchange factor n=1 Tax=Teratosphaeria destructans TaxID=418781 RepID=A0A9W7W7J2_9PEZI|nr:Guanine nucleotide exchange factor [Teratosphaeria destructans]